MKKKTQPKLKNKNAWDMSLLYSSLKDPRIEKDLAESEKQYEAFASTYDTTEMAYLHGNSQLLKALTDYEKLASLPGYRGAMYFYFLRDTDAHNKNAASQIALLENRLTQMYNRITFFGVSLSKIPKKNQGRILTDPTLAKYKVLLQRIFHDGAHTLSVAEEKILSLKSQPAHSMWVSGNEKVLNMKSITWKGKKIAIPEAKQVLFNSQSPADRNKLNTLIQQELKSVAPFSEAEINAIFTDKKIDDELRGYKRPFDATVHGYRNDPRVVEQLVKTVTESFPVAHRFYKLKAKLLKQKTLRYHDREVKIGKTSTKFTFDTSAQLLIEILDSVDPKLSKIFQNYAESGQLDIYPKIGKKGGAYCWGTYVTPTFILLNHTNELNSFKTLAHEMGHAFHGELSHSQGPIYSDYSFSLAETASTLFETLALEFIFEKLSDKEKIIALHDRIADNISTVMRQIAGFNYELDLHTTIRTKGYINHEEMALLHNKHMKSYLGPAFTLVPDDGYFFVQWGHIRRFFYVYSYAYGMLVSKAMLRRYKKDPSFWKSIEQFLSAGGSDSPENILKSIGIDVTKPEFWKEGIQEIADDIALLKKLTKDK